MIDTNGKIKENFFWFNEPVFTIQESRKLEIQSSPDTDFWQNTHYGFQRDNGHCLLTRVSDNFSMTVRTEFYPKEQYDQCGLIVRLDSKNWIKASVEFEKENFYRLGSVVTNKAYSDWSTIDINSKINSMWYRIQSNHNDFLLEYSYDGKTWVQQRITHINESFSALSVGVYACSPMDSTFKSVFDNFNIGDSHWH